MADLFDKAQDADALFRNLALAQATRRTTPGPGATHCIECGEEIPEKRRLAMPGCRYCVDCLEELELKNKRLR